MWIGDDILDAAVERFGRLAVSRRNVSLVPGPLEARKRETKRRLAHISQANGGVPGSIDPSLLAGINERAHKGQWRWQAPGMPEKPEPTPLPRWLAGLIHHPTARSATARPQDKEAAELRPREEQQDIAYQLQEHAFLSRLARCRTLGELRDLASFFEIDVRKYSSKVFRQLYDSHRSLKSCLDFLGDTSIDDPYAQNLRYLLVQLSQQLKDQIDAEPARLVSVLRAMLVPWVKSQVSLGKRSRTDIKQLAIFISDLAQLKPFELLTRDIALAVLGGLRSSTVLGFHDLAPEVCSFLLDSITKGGLTFELQDLGLSLAETVTNTVLVSRFLAKCIKSRPALYGLQEVRAWQQCLFPRICNLLHTRPQADRNFIVRYASRDLVIWQSSLPYSSLLCAGLMDQWWSTIAKTVLPNFLTHGLGSLKIERLMPSDRPDTLALYANHLGGRKKARFVLSNWFAGRLSVYDFKKLSYELKENLEMATNDSPFLCMLRTAHKSGFLRYDFVRHSFQLLSRMRMYRVMTEIVMRAESSGIYIPPRVVLDTIRQVLSISPKQAYRIFRCDPRIPLESLPSLAVSMIKYPSLHPDIVWHYQRKRPWQSIPNALELSADSLRRDRSQFLDTIALAYSRSPKLSARMARRQVMKCVQCYRKEALGPLSPHISHALVRSGIIRPLQEKQWLSNRQLAWVLSIVRQVEGPARADEIDRVLSIWRGQLWRRGKQNSILERSLRPRGGPLSFIFRPRWSKTHRRYDRVMHPAHRRPQMTKIEDSRSPDSPLDIVSRDWTTYSVHPKDEG